MYEVIRQRKISKGILPESRIKEGNGNGNDNSNPESGRNNPDLEFSP
jgi:hypothetical protein